MLTLAATMSLRPVVFAIMQALAPARDGRGARGRRSCRGIGLDPGPVVEPAIDLDGPRFDRRRRAGPFVAPDVGDHLIVVVVAMAALHRLDVATELGVELVDEGDRPGAVQAACWRG